MAFPFAEPADPARYYAQGLAIGERIKENAAAQERNKLLDTFNQSMARIQLGMKVEDQAFDRQNTLEDNQRQQQALGASLINAANAAQPKPQWRNVNGKWVQVTADNPLSGVLNQGIQMATGGTPNTVPRTEADEFSILPNKPRPLPQEEPDNVGGMLPDGPAIDVAQPAVVEGTPLPPELQSPADAVTSPPVSSPPLMLTPPEPVAAPAIPSIFAPVSPGPVAPVTPAQADTAPPEAPPSAAATPLVIGGITIPPGTDEGTVQNITSVQSSLSKAQAAFDAALARQTALNAELEQEAIDISNMGGTPPSLLDDINRRKIAPVEDEVRRTNEALKNEREKLESIVRENNKALAADRESVLRTQQAERLIGQTVADAGIPQNHPAIKGWEREFEPLNKNQQGRFIQGIQEKVKTVGDVESTLNGPLFAPIKEAEPQLDGPLQVKSNPIDVRNAMTRVLQAKVAVETTAAAANPPEVIGADGKPKRGLPDEAAKTRHQNAVTRYEEALATLRAEVNVLPKPAPKDLMPAGSGVLLRPSEAAAAPVAPQPAASRSSRGLEGVSTPAAAENKVPQWWTEQKAQVAQGRGSDGRVRVPSLSEFNDETLLAVAFDEPVYSARGGGLTLNRERAALRASEMFGESAIVAGKAADNLARELGFDPEGLPAGGDSRQNTGNRWSDIRYRDVVREAAMDEATRRGLVRDRKRVNTSQPIVPPGESYKKLEAEAAP